MKEAGMTSKEYGEQFDTNAVQATFVQDVDRVAAEAFPNNGMLRLLTYTRSLKLAREAASSPDETLLSQEEHRKSIAELAVQQVTGMMQEGEVA